MPPARHARLRNVYEQMTERESLDDEVAEGSVSRRQMGEHLTQTGVIPTALPC